VGYGSDPRVADVISTEPARIQRRHPAWKHRPYYGLSFLVAEYNIFRPALGARPGTYGEDPYLTSRIGVAFVTGLQGDDPTI